MTPHSYAAEALAGGIESELTIRHAGSRKRQCGREVRRIAADRNRGAGSSRSVGSKHKADRGVLANRDRDRKTWSTQGEILVGDRDAADRNGSRSGIRDGCGKCFARACRDTAKLQAGAAQNQSARLLLLIRRLSGTKSLATNQGYEAKKNQSQISCPEKNRRVRRSKPSSHRGTQQRDSTNSLGIRVGRVRTESRVQSMFRVDFGGSQQKHAGRPTPGFTKVKPPPVQRPSRRSIPPESPAFPSCELKFQLVPRFRARV